MIAYLILFLPLIASVSCFLVNFKKSDFLIFAATIFILLILTTKLSFDFNISGAIKNDAGLGILSIPTEYYLDFLSLFFLFMVLIAKILMAVFYQNDFIAALKNDNRQLLHAAWLLNIFGVVGVFMTNNIFNLFIFIEIYCLTLCAIIAMSNDLDLSKLSFKYFCNSVLGSILLLLAIVLLYSSSGHLQIEKIADALSLENSSLIFSLFAIAIWLKFFPVNLYFKILESNDPLANFLLCFAFVISGAVGFYLLLRVLLPLFDLDVIFLNATVLVGFILVIYSNYKMLKVQHLKSFAAYFLLMSFGFILITFFVEDSFKARLFYISNYILTGLAIFLLDNFLKNKYQDSHFKYLRNEQKLIIIFIVLSLPFTLMFWANWYLAIASIGSVSGLLAILPIIITNLSMAYLATSLISDR
jgi:multicomponent Na+:H+ antiporter subunit D